MPDSTDATYNWFFRNNWHQVSWYAVAPDIAPSGPRACGANCLTVNFRDPANPAVAATNQRGMIVIAGRALTGQTRTWPFTVTDWLEDANNDGNLVITSQENGARRLALSHDASGWTVAERWTSNALKPYFNDFVIHKGHAFGFDGRILSCIDLKDGQRKWKGGRYGNGQLVLLADQDLLLVLSEEGELALVRATPYQFTEIAKLPAIQGILLIRRRR